MGFADCIHHEICNSKAQFICLSLPSDEVLTLGAPIMIPSGVPSVWKPLIRDGRNQACRPFHFLGFGRAYKVYFNQSIRKCQELCVKTPSCKGIEHNFTGRCEVWTQPIDYTVPSASFRCLRYEPPVVNTSNTLTTTTVTKEFISAGKDRACYGKQHVSPAMVNTCRM